MSCRKLLWLVTIAVASWGLNLLLALRYPLGPSLENPWASMVEPTGLKCRLAHRDLSWPYPALPVNASFAGSSQEENSAP